MSRLINMYDLEVGDIWGHYEDEDSYGWEVLEIIDGTKMRWKNTHSDVQGVTPLSQLGPTCWVYDKHTNSKAEKVLQKIRYLNERYQSRRSKAPMSSMQEARLG